MISSHTRRGQTVDIDMTCLSELVFSCFASVLGSPGEWQEKMSEDEESGDQVIPEPGCLWTTDQLDRT